MKIARLYTQIKLIIMYKFIQILTILFGIGLTANAQYHTLDLPQPSPFVEETQELGITKVTLKYSSPAVQGRQLWGNVVPMNGDPVPWRTGANLNTIISFSTDVTINGQPLQAGSYGFHTIPGTEEWTLLFANNDNIWGSYYLDLENEVELNVNVLPEVSEHQEQLNFNFRSRTDSTLQIAIEWGEVAVPFTVGIDLNKTVVASLRYQLKGHTTNAWNAWTTAALWCLDHNTNLEEAWKWANRSVIGGFGGFRATKNFDNLAARARIELALQKTDDAKASIKEAAPLMSDPYNTYSTGMAILRESENPEIALQVFTLAEEKFEDTWYIPLGSARAYSVLGEFKEAQKALKKTMDNAPENYKEFLNGEMEKLNNHESLI